MKFHTPLQRSIIAMCMHIYVHTRVCICLDFVCISALLNQSFKGECAMNPELCWCSRAESHTQTGGLLSSLIGICGRWFALVAQTPYLPWIPALCSMASELPPPAAQAPFSLLACFHYWGISMCGASRDPKKGLYIQASFCSSAFAMRTCPTSSERR